MSDRKDQRRDYPAVEFTLVGDEGKSPEEIEKEIEMIIKKRDLLIALDELGWNDDD